MRLSKKAANEIKKCRGDFLYFCTKYLKIIDKKGNVVALSPNYAQRKFLEAKARNPWVYVLKSRKLGITTFEAAFNFWMTLFTPAHQVLVLAHTDSAAKSIFRIYQRFYDLLPPFLKFDTKMQNKHELEFVHGGYIKAATAGSDSARGSTFRAIHCSEFAQYENIEELIASAMSTAGQNSFVTLETTARGLNAAHKIWEEPNGFEKLFISWREQEDARLKKKPDWIPPEVEHLKEDYELDKYQLNWAAQTYATRCAANWNTFLQEYPPEAHLAFISSGKRFFNRVYPHSKPSPGYKQYMEPQKFKCYAMGVDVASGSEHGDYSAFVTLDCTDKKNPLIVSTLYEHISPSDFTDRIMEEAKKYNALVCVESNSYGLSVIEGLVAREYVHLYRRVKYDKVTNRWTENLGFNTNRSTRAVLIARLQEYISREYLIPNDETLKAEMNSFVFNKSGKPEADSGHHDDMVMATGLALMGMTQVEVINEIKKKEPPGTVKEILEFEMQTGRMFKSSKHLFEERKSLSDDKPPSLDGIM
jgi:hypothetical protein